MNIFGQKIKIKYMKTQEALGVCGFFDPVKQIIVIDDSMDKQMQMETLIHECVHALSFRLSWRQAINQQFEETMCDQIAKMLVESFDIKLKSKK